MRFYKNHIINKIIISLLALSVITGLIDWRSTSAQSQTADQTWTAPVNLSHSGSTTRPAMIVDSNGIIHVVWVDTIAGEMYSSYDGTQWSAPVSVSLPFATTFPRLFADSKGYVHAFWVDQNNQLNYSRVLGSQFANGANWDATQTLANSAVDYDVALDNQDHIHLAYVRILDEGGFPAGIYYRQSTANGASWSNVKILYQSQYFRSLTNQNANVSIATDRKGAGQNIYVAWDNRPRKQVYFSNSTDGGDKWSDPSEIDKPEATNGFATPFNIRVVANDQGIMMEWQVGDPVGSCTQDYQWSTDAGVSWSDRQSMLNQLGACAQENQYFETKDGTILLASTIQTQIYFLAWNGSQWSDAQPQSELSGFQDPETFDQVVFDCRDLTLGTNNQIDVVGCDTGSGGDIWQTSFPLDNINAWFPLPSAWKKPIELSTGLQDFTNPIIIADSSGKMHAFWTQVNPNLGTNPQYASLFYARWDGQIWSTPLEVISSQDGDIINPSIVIDSADVLYATWTVQQTGIAYFSKVNANRAANAPEWIQPVAITSDNEIAASPKIIVDRTGLISIIYAVPVNENRGIYQIQSSDNGGTWSAPIKIFDGLQAGWEQVGMPHVTRGLDGQLHVIWSRIPFGLSGEAQSLFYSRSADGGKTWSPPESVVDTIIDWSNIVAISNNEIHRYWLENQDGSRVLWYESSKDNGINWSRPASVSYFGSSLSSVALTLDPGLNPFLFQITQDSFGKVILNDWQWISDNWSASDPLTLGEGDGLTNENLAAAVSPTGILGAIYANSFIDPVSNTKNYSMNFAVRSIEITSTVPTLTKSTPFPITEAPTETPQVAGIITQTLVTTPTVDVLANLGNPSPSSSSWTGLIIGSSLAGLLVILAFGYGFFKMRK